MSSWQEIKKWIYGRCTNPSRYSASWFGGLISSEVGDFLQLQYFLKKWKWPFMNSSTDKHFKNKGKVILRSLKPEADGSWPATMVLLKGREWSLSFSVLSLSFLWPLLLARQLSPPSMIVPLNLYLWGISTPLLIHTSGILACRVCFVHITLYSFTD